MVIQMDKKKIETYYQKLKILDEFNKAYDVGMNLYRVFNGNVLNKISEGQKNVDEILEESFNETKLTFEGKKEFIYGLEGKLK